MKESAVAVGTITRHVRVLAASVGFVASLLRGNIHAGTQTGANILVVVNDTTRMGNVIATRYAERRAIPRENICHLRTTDEETISRNDYVRQIEQRVWQCLTRISAQEDVLYIVLTKGMPIRVAGSAGVHGTAASVDSELALLYRRATGRPTPVEGRLPNPYFAGTTEPSTWTRFSRAQQDLYLVSRLDGYTLEDALALIERSLAAQRAGRFVLDERASWRDDGNGWLRRASRRLAALGLSDRVLLDESGAVVHGQTNVLGYYSWGSNDPAIRRRHVDLGFVPGALAAMFVSTDARTFLEPPSTWVPGEWSDRRTYFGGSPQSLVGDLVRDGVTGAAGHVDEPYLDATIRPDILFPAYARGMTLGESFYLAMPYLSWQTIVIGDPLCAPFSDRTRAARVR